MKRSSDLTRYIIDFADGCHLQPEDAHLQGVYDVEGVQVYLVADVEAANAWRYDEPPADLRGQWLIVTHKGRSQPGYLATYGSWLDNFGREIGASLPWRPLPAPAKEQE